MTAVCRHYGELNCFSACCTYSHQEICGGTPCLQLRSSLREWIRVLLRRSFLSLWKFRYLTILSLIFNPEFIFINVICFTIKV